MPWYCRFGRRSAALEVRSLEDVPAVDCGRQPRPLFIPTTMSDDAHPPAPPPKLRRRERDGSDSPMATDLAERMIAFQRRTAA